MRITFHKDLRLNEVSLQKKKKPRSSDLPTMLCAQLVMEDINSAVVRISALVSILPGSHAGIWMIELIRRPNYINNHRDGVRCCSSAHAMIPMAAVVSQRVLCGVSFGPVVGDWVS